MITPNLASLSYFPSPEFWPCNLSIMRATFASFVCKSLVTLEAVEVGRNIGVQEDLGSMPGKAEGLQG
jgi:hypothetical protein